MLSFPIPNSAWEPICPTDEPDSPDDHAPDGRCRLSCRVRIADVDCHVEAIEIVRRKTEDVPTVELQVGRCCDGDERLDALCAEYDCSAVQTFKIGEREYTIAIYPCDA